MTDSRASLFKYLLLITRIALGAIFIAAAIGKIVYPAEFAKIVYNYKILPDSAINLVSIILPWLEVLLGGLIIAGMWLPGAVVLANALLLTFFGALIYNVARGLNIHCGCFSLATSGSPQTTWYIIRDSLFLLLGLTTAALVFIRSKQVKS